MNDHACSTSAGVCPCQIQAWHKASREILEWCNEVIGDRDLGKYEEFGSLRDDPQSLAVTLAVETRKILIGVGIEP